MSTFQQLESVPCAICGIDDVAPLFQVDGHSLVQCRSCRLVYVNPRLTADERVKARHRIYGTESYEPQYLRDQKEFERRFVAKLRVIERFAPPGSVLDVGCSYGFFLRVARERGWRAVGIDGNPRAVQYAREEFGLDVRQSLIEEVNFPDGSFDVITLWDVLEHANDPLRLIRDLRPMLAPEGLLCVQCPNIESLVARRERERWDWLTPEDHLYHFTVDTLTRLLMKGDYRVIWKSTWEPMWVTADALLYFSSRSGKVWELYRRTLLRVLRKLGFFIYLPLQMWEQSNERGALIFLIARKG